MTRRLATVQFIDVADPVAWDRRLNTTDNPGELLAYIDPTEGPLHARRYLQAALAGHDNLTLLAALRQMADLGFTGSEGVRMRALAALYRYEEISDSAPMYPTSTDPNELENVLEYEMAMCDARAHAGDKVQALAHVHGAHLLASGLGMKHRTQWLGIEKGRLLTLAGNRASPHIRDAMNLLPMTKRRQEWGMQTLAESYIAEGEFRKALELLDELRPALWYFAGALLGCEATREHLPSQTGHYADLARAIWNIRGGDEYALTGVYEHYPQKGYAQVLRARAMITTPALRNQSVSALSALNVPDLTQDQRVYLAIMKLGACAESGDVLVGQVAIRELRIAIDSLSIREHVVPLLHAMSPNRSALASLVPGAHHALALRMSELPMLVGEHVLFRGRSIKLPGKAAGGISMVRSAFYGEPVQMHHEATKRMKAALAKQDITLELVNVGYLLRCLKRLCDAAPADQRGPWVSAIENTLNLIDSRALQTDLKKDLTLL